MRYFILFAFFSAFMCFFSKAEVPTPAFYTVHPSFVNFLKGNEVGLSGGAEVVVSEKILKTYSILKKGIPFDLTPHVHLGVSVDETSVFSASISSTIKLHYENKRGVSAKITYQMDQENISYSYTSIYAFTKIPLAYKYGLSVLYAGVSGKDLDYKNAYEEIKKLIGERVDWFIGINYNFHIFESVKSLNLEFHPDKKNVYISLNWGV